MAVDADDLPQRHGQCIVPVDTERGRERERKQGERVMGWGVRLGDVGSFGGA